MQNRPLTELFHRYLLNDCSPDEVRELLQYFCTESEAALKELIREALQQTDDTATGPRLHAMSREVLQRIRATMNTGEEPAPVVLPSRQRLPVRRILSMAAACLFLLSAAGIYFLTRNTAAPVKKMPSLVSRPVQDTLAPAGNKAVLTLSTGQQINLDGARDGQVATDNNALIRKSAEGKIEYEKQSADGRAAGEISYNTLTTPRGGKYDLTLSDGTRVSLNAASSIRYPSVFPEGSRQVEITGEVYFEVTHNAGKPFRISVAGQQIEDLGTRFNVNAYSDEPNLIATLLEGSIRVSNKSHAVLLKPGQQAVIQPDQSLRINREADLEEVTAWHRGLFTFHDADIQTVMRQLSRWYDVDVTYEGAVTRRRFSGKIYRNISALKVADILKYKQINFRIEGRTIIVLP